MILVFVVAKDHLVSLAVLEPTASLVKMVTWVPLAVQERRERRGPMGILATLEDLALLAFLASLVGKGTPVNLDQLVQQELQETMASRGQEEHLALWVKMAEQVPRDSKAEQESLVTEVQWDFQAREDGMVTQVQRVQLAILVLRDNRVNPDHQGKLASQVHRVLRVTGVNTDSLG